MKSPSFSIVVFMSLLFLWTGSMHGQSSLSLEIDSVWANMSNRSIDLTLSVIANDQPYTSLERGDIEIYQDGELSTLIELNQPENNGIYLLKTRSDGMFFTGESHNISVLWKKNSGSSANTEFTVGSLMKPFPPPRQFSWMDIMVIGLLIVALLLLGLSEGIALYKRLIFRSKHVKYYRDVKTPKVVKRDPLTDDTFRDDDLVVIKCRMMTSWDTWKFNDHRCMDYPDCMYASNPCHDGETFTGYDKFFSQKGIYKKLNWLWLGSLGGVLAGLVWTAFTGSSLSSESSQGLLGLALGLTLATTLAWAEERGLGRAISWERILLRALVGAVTGGVIFYLGGWIGSIIGDGYILQLVIWLLFGTAIGYVLSMKSSILPLRGIIAGLIGSFVGFNLYYFLLTYFKDPGMAIIISLICFGAIMAIIMVTVINRLEDFELEVLSPPEFRRNIPISKWLKQQIDIYIGTDLGNYVCVKWKDEEVIDRHVQLSYDKDRVYIEPMAETLLNGRRIPNRKKIPLKDGDVLQLGHESISRMQYREKTIKQ